MNTCSISRPKQVKIAVTLLLITVLLGALGQIVTISSLSNIYIDHMTTQVVGLIIGIIINICLIYYIWKGKNWARITLLVLFILYIILAIVCYFTGLLNPALTGSLATLHVILTIIAYVYLFLKDSNEWFIKARNK